jgi:crotonobetainyl-CoA:carnitine CoA-transferase CaiB-like acyl-CoA transferase
VQKVRQLADWGANVIKIGAPEAVDGSKGMGGERDGSDFQKYASEQAQNVI